MEYKKYQNNIILRLDPGEEIVSSLMKLADEEDIKLAVFNGLGAINEFELGLFDTENKKYHSNKYLGPFEITSLHGTLTRKDNEPYVHAHLNASDINNKVIGGHLGNAKISATGEIIINVINGEVGRKFNKEIDLNLFDFR